MTLPTDPADLSATQARRLLARRNLSCAELVEACLARVAALDHAINAIVDRDEEKLRKEAEAADAAIAKNTPLGPLHGLPFAVKDMIDVTGLRTTYGSEIFRDNVANKDDAIVAAMRRAGAMPLGKTNVPEWSAGGNTRNRVYGVTPNPHDLTRNAGGSSGGSAAALACGYAPLATGSDTGGSLRTPAAYCGVVGFRPSPGLVPGDTRAMGLIPMSTSGPMARNVEDCALMLSVLARPDNTDPYTTVIDGRTPWRAADFTRLPRVDLTALKIAFSADYGFAPTENAIRRPFAKAVETLAPALGELVPGHPDCTDADRIFAVLRAVQYLGRHANLVDTKPDLVGPNVTDNVAEGRRYSAADVADALVRQTAYHHRWQAFFEDHDIVLTPAATIGPRNWREFVPTEIDGTPTQSYYHWLAMAYASTIPGHPSITIPCGRDENGMPFGLQIVGRRHGDLTVLAVANELEAAIAGQSDLAPRGPDRAALKAAPPISAAPGFLTFD